METADDNPQDERRDGSANSQRDVEEQRETLSFPRAVQTVSSQRKLLQLSSVKRRGGQRRLVFSCAQLLGEIQKKRED